MFAARLRVRHAALPLAVLLAACASAPVPAPLPPPRPVPTPAAMVAAIQTAGASEESVIAVHPLADPGIDVWKATAEADVQAGQYAAAALKLDQALGRSPDSPELLQDRAEVAIYQHDYAQAQKLAQESWTLGPKLGPLCARNWETIAQTRLADADDAGVATARKWVAKCHVQGIQRF